MNSLAQLLGWIVMAGGGMAFTITLVWLAIDRGIRFLSDGDAWWQVVKRMHAARAFKWQRKDR